MSLLKPLFISVLLPLIIGALIKTYAGNVADKIFSPVKKLAGLSTLLTIIFCILLYYKQMWATAGSMAMLSLTIFTFVMGLVSFYTGFGLKRSEKIVMSLGMGTRNIAAVLIGVLYNAECKTKYGGDGCNLDFMVHYSCLYYCPHYGQKG